jgi:iron complex transport system substrate-binding protein
MVQKKLIRERVGWGEVDAVRRNQIYEIKSTYILQPGPAALTEGVRQLHLILARVAGVSIDPNLAPLEKVDRDHRGLSVSFAVR